MSMVDVAHEDPSPPHSPHSSTTESPLGTPAQSGQFSKVPPHTPAQFSTFPSQSQNPSGIPLPLRVYKLGIM